MSSKGFHKKNSVERFEVESLNDVLQGGVCYGSKI